jgi:hypothetical protein
MSMRETRSIKIIKVLNELSKTNKSTFTCIIIRITLIQRFDRQIIRINGYNNSLWMTINCYSYKVFDQGKFIFLERN